VKLTKVDTLVANQDRQAIPDIPRLRPPYENIQNQHDKSRDEDKLHASIGGGFKLLDRAGVVD
jgi:hypothetical protein